MPRRYSIISSTAKVVLNTALVISLGAVLLFSFTDGLRALTSEGARRLAIERNPVSVPSVNLISADERKFQISDFKDKTLLVDFIFTSCTGICPMMTQNFHELFLEAQSPPLKGKLALLTISFDPERDSPSLLQRYSQAIGADSDTWVFATVQDTGDLQELLEVFGIVVIPAPNGQFEHNSAIHLVNTEHELAKIYDIDAIEQILSDLKREYENA